MFINIFGVTVPGEARIVPENTNQIGGILYVQPEKEKNKGSVTLAVRVVPVIRLACAKLFPWKLFDS